MSRSLMGSTKTTRRRQQLSWVLSGCMLIIAVSFLTAGAAQAQGQWPRVAASKDGTPITYEVFDKIGVPVITVNADLWPINDEANRRHMSSFDAIVIKGVDHFLMMTRPAEFNLTLEKAIQAILEKS